MRRLHKDHRGSTAIEYALIAALIAVVAIPGLKAVGDAINSSLANAAATLNGG